MKGIRGKEEARKVGRPPLAMPEPINDTPENVAKAILSTPPKKRDEWRFMQQKKSADRQPDRAE
jgi:hypothetical protein